MDNKLIREINPTFILKKPSNIGKSLISLQVKWNGYRLIYSTKQSIPPNFWDKKRQRVKNNQMTVQNGHYYLNDLLSNIENVVTTSFRKESANGIPTVQQIRKHLDEFFKRNEMKEQEENAVPTFYQLIDRFIANDILYKGNRKSEGTIKTYRTTLMHLKNFEAAENYSLSYASITLEFFYKWVAYLRSVGVKEQNSLNKYLACLKAFMSEAVDLGFSTNMEFRRRKFGVSQINVENVYLTEAEILEVYKADVSHNPNLENVRDAFVIACMTGMRFGDFSSLKMEHIQEINGERFIRKNTLKTGEQVIIPLTDTVIEILGKYKDTPKGFPKVPSNPVFNKQIKVVCKAAGLDVKGRLTTDPSLPLYECVSAHTGRRSFATNAYLKNISIAFIMKLTGHRTERSFMKYIKLTPLHAAIQFGKMNNMDKSKLALKVAI
ncbi:tyrosine-type recombinase/integrase [Parasediminibacterium sp. JCM 36343]|uniref:site-specific integrase n=1 Tax=Parasediminibacterium sp. JCM 36343 TaxID=3374279 RepID=UPI00397DC297